MAKNVLTDYYSAPLPEATAAKFDIHAGDGNLTIDALATREPVLACGSLQYLEGQSLPARTLDASGGQATLTLRGGVDLRPRFRLPWATCNGATEWQIHLNPDVPAEISACSNGGNVRLNLAGLSVSHVMTETGGGNVDLVLPEGAASLEVKASTGGGNLTVDIGGATTGRSAIDAGSGAGTVTVRIPSGMAARIHATTGLGKIIMDPQFSQVDKTTYQSPGFDSAADRVEIKAHSGAGNITVQTK